MINASLKMFGSYGYRFASTDDIVKEAGISKGLLFHYFGSKLGVYTFVYDYSVRFMTMELKNAVQPDETDFFNLYIQIEQGKLQVLKNYPCMQLFLDKCNTENVSEALLAIEEKRREIEALYQSIFSQADLSRLPKYLDVEKLRYMLHSTLLTLMESHFTERDFHAEMVYEENVAYIELLRAMVKK